MARTLAMRRAQQAAERAGTARAVTPSPQEEPAQDVHTQENGNLLETGNSTRRFVTPVSVYDSGALSNITKTKAMSKGVEPTESNMVIQTPTVAQSIEEDMGANTRLDTQNELTGHETTLGANSRIRRHRTADYVLKDYLTPSTPPATRLRSGKPFASEPPDPANPKLTRGPQPTLETLGGRRRTADRSLIDYLSPRIPPTSRLRPRSRLRSETPMTGTPRSPQKRNVKMTGVSHIQSDHHNTPSYSEVEGNIRGIEKPRIEGPSKDTKDVQRIKSSRAREQKPNPSPSRQVNRRHGKDGVAVSQTQPQNSTDNNPEKMCGTGQSKNAKPIPKAKRSLIVKLKMDPDLLTGWQLQQFRAQVLQNGRKRKHSSARSDDAKPGANKVTTTHTPGRAKATKRRRQVSPAKPVPPSLPDCIQNTPTAIGPIETGTESRESRPESDSEEENMYARPDAASPFNSQESFIDLTRDASASSTEEDPTSWPLRIPLPPIPDLPKAPNVLEHFAQGVCIALENIVEDYHAAEDEEEDEEWEYLPGSIADIVEGLEDNPPQFEVGNYYDYRLTVLKGNEWVYKAVRIVLREVDVDETESEMDEEGSGAEEGGVRREGPRVEEVCAIVSEGFRTAMAEAGVRVRVYKREVVRSEGEVERRRVRRREQRRERKRKAREWEVEREEMVEEMERERSERRATEGLMERERDVESEFRALLGMERSTSEVARRGEGHRTMTAGEKMRERLARVKRIEGLRRSMRETSVGDKLRERMRRIRNGGPREEEGIEWSEDDSHEEEGEEEGQEEDVVEDGRDDRDDHENHNGHKSHATWLERVCVMD